jgi:hypothetical protein
MNTTRRIQAIAEQAVTLNTPPASTPAWKQDVEFGRAHSMRIWDAVAEIRSGKQAPPPPRNSPDHVVPRRPAADDLNDDDDAPPEPELDDDEASDDDATCTCDCEECRDGRCEDCSDLTCDDPNCKHAEQTDDSDSD